MNNNPLCVKAIALIMALGTLGSPAEDNLDGNIGKANLNPPIHPQVFALVGCWLSDAESPVVTEFNLDAVTKNNDQFDKDAVTIENGWTVLRSPGKRGFKRYRILEGVRDRYKVEFQENGGGSLTTSSLIEFSVTKRSIQIEGKERAIRVLRVTSWSAK